ncbi:acyltransferase [Plantactinospora sp. KLBMP9567]|uniref:acyltransferase family protein n=1 Tax=Plantactinospora sp. KLBMP9567 TaxID=3085900 RepID=UPI002981E593|nr:acyltransferase [Plantactinospora sp. KLBMP9567]MDW5328177.1 acyltransferase [Plantactinospora sp. KLBMP9567]
MSLLERRPTDGAAPHPPSRAGSDGGGRDRGVDGLRAYAIGGVVFGHWLVTALVLGPDGALRPASPLAAMPALVPVTWLFQTLGLFFFVSGYASARSLRSAAARGLGPARWLRRRLGRLGRPVLLLLGGWLAVLAVAALLGTPAGTLRTAATLVVSPLWFLLPLVVLIASTAPLARALDRYGPVRLAVPAVALVTLSDLAGRSGDPSGWPVPLPGDGVWRVPVAVLAGWLLPYLLGMALADGRLGGRRTAVGLLLAGAAGMAGLGGAGYPLSAVGVPGDGMSNLDPPSLFAVSLALAQVGAALLVRPALAGALARPGRWAPVSRLNTVAISVYLWHQSTLLGVTALATLAARLAGTGPVPGLHTVPDGPGWVAARLAWLPLLVLVLSVLVGRAGGDRRRRRHRHAKGRRPGGFRTPRTGTDSEPSST